MRSDPARTALIFAIRQADLNPPLGYPGGPCQVIERINEEVRGQKDRERLIQLVEDGEKLSNKDTSLIYDRDSEGRAKGSPFKQVLLTSHAQYRMDLRGVTVQEVKLALRNFHDMYQRDPMRWDRYFQTSKDFYWRDPKLDLSMVMLVGNYSGSKAAQIISVWWGSSEREGVPMARNKCKTFDKWVDQEPSAQRVASKHMEASVQDIWLQWIVQPFSALAKHHKKFVNGPVDDAMDEILRDVAPHLVKEVVEREVDEDVDEFLEGAQEGRFESLAGFKEDPESGVSSDYLLGYDWGYENARRWDGRDLPKDVKKDVVNQQLREFKGEITEQVVIDALEKAWKMVNPREVFRTIIRAVKQYGWKIGLIYGIGEIIENFVIPGALSVITGIPIPPGSTGWIPLNDIVFAIIVKRLGKSKSVDDFEEDGHLDWYESQFGPVRVACLRRNGDPSS